MKKDMKKNSQLKEKITTNTFLVFYIIYIISVLAVAYAWGLDMNRGLAIYILAAGGLFVSGIAILVLAVIILIKAKKTNSKQLRTYGVLCRYILIAPLVSAILLYFANNVANRIEYRGFLDRNTLNKLSFISFLVINAIGVINTVLYKKWLGGGIRTER